MGMKQVQSKKKNKQTINLDNKALMQLLYLHASGIVCVVKGEVRSLAERQEKPQNRRQKYARNKN